MAFEDRCSPQSAPSPPPDIPHSPQNTAILSSSNGNELHNGNSNSSFSIEQEMSITVPADERTISSTSPSSLLCVAVKQEKNEKRITHQNNVEQKTLTPITFSISNILSNSFGNKTSQRKSVASEKKSSILFRPYDDDVVISAKRQKLKSESDDDDDGEDEEIEVTDSVAAESPKFQNGAIDFSSNRGAQHLPSTPPQPPVQPQPHHYQVVQPLYRHNSIEHSPIYPAFYQSGAHPSLAKSIFPASKLHDDILSSTKKYQQYYQTTQLLTDSVLAKYPPLGNLCKTVSQIGQNTSPTINNNNNTNINNNKITSPALPTESPPKKVSNSLSQLNASRKQSSSSSGLSPNKEQATTKSQQSNGMDSGMESSEDTKSETSSTKDDNGAQLWPAWIYCTRYSDRPSSGPRYRKPKQPKDKTQVPDEKRPRTAFSLDQLARLKREFNENRYLTERRRQQLSSELGLNEAQIKIWFQNKRAKIKKSTGQKNPLAMQLMAQGLYNHSTVPLTKEEEELEMRMNGQL